MKITEIFDVQNSDSNLILGRNTYILIHDYENYKNRLQDYSATLELLTQRALNLSLFRNPPQKLKTSKPSYPTKNEKSKQVEKKSKIEGVMSGELLLLKKLLLVNLRSFRIMQQLFKENKELQMLLNDSRVFTRRQNQKIEYAKKENESLRKTEAQLKERLGSFLRQLNRASKRFIAGFKNDCQDDSNNKLVSLIKDKSECNSQKLELAFNFSTNVANRLRNNANDFLQINNFNQELSFSYDLDIILRDLKIRLVTELPLYNFFNSKFEHMYVDHEIKYPLLVWETKNCNENADIQESHLKECGYKIDKDIQNAIRLHSVNSSIWRSFLLMKTIQEFVIFDQLYELIKAFLIAAKACESETSSETNETVFSQLENSNVCSFVSESTNECISQSSFSLYELTDEVSNERIKGYPKKRYPRTKVFYSLKQTHKKIISGTSSKKKSKRRISKESFSITETTSIGVGDNCIVSVDRECQVEDNIFIEPMHETLVKIESKVNFENELDKKVSSLTTLYSGRRDFKKSLKSLEDVIKSCQQKTEQETAIKPKKKRFNGTEKNANAQRKRDTKMKEAKKKNRNDNRNPFDFYKKENRKNSKLPEMSKMYQIILENRLPRGVSFEYLTPDKSKVQLLFVSNSRDPHGRRL